MQIQGPDLLILQSCSDILLEQGLCLGSCAHARTCGDDLRKVAEGLMWSAVCKTAKEHVAACRDHACFTGDVCSSSTRKRKPCSCARTILSGLLRLTQQLLAQTRQGLHCCSGQCNNNHRSSSANWQSLQRSCESCFCSSRLHKPLTASVAARLILPGRGHHPIRRGRTAPARACIAT